MGIPIIIPTDYAVTCSAYDMEGWVAAREGRATHRARVPSLRRPTRRQLGVEGTTEAGVWAMLVDSDIELEW